MCSVRQQRRSLTVQLGRAGLEHLDEQRHVAIDGIRGTLLVEDVEQAASQAIDLELRATDATAANVEWMLLLMLLTQLLDEFLGRADAADVIIEWRALSSSARQTHKPTFTIEARERDRKYLDRCSNVISEVLGYQPRREGRDHRVNGAILNIQASSSLHAHNNAMRLQFGCCCSRDCSCTRHTRNKRSRLSSVRRRSVKKMLTAVCSSSYASYQRATASAQVHRIESNRIESSVLGDLERPATTPSIAVDPT